MSSPYSGLIQPSFKPFAISLQRAYSFPHPNFLFPTPLESFPFPFRRYNTVRAKNIGRDIAAGFKNMVGGELKGYTELLTESRREAMSRMIAQAEALGANAVVNVRFSTSAITSGASEMMAYGTAVVAE